MPFLSTRVQSAIGGIIRGVRETANAYLAVDVDPEQPIDFVLEMQTFASALGWAQAYAGIRQYSLEIEATP